VCKNFLSINNTLQKSKLSEFDMIKVLQVAPRLSENKIMNNKSHVEGKYFQTITLITLKIATHTSLPSFKNPQVFKMGCAFISCCQGSHLSVWYGQSVYWKVCPCIMSVYSSKNLFSVSKNKT
jgi:hypothetical protein